ncbi:MAG TPA: 50S ribosomal protein L6 [Gammaproteobacteria bacterium]|nr:50S ribosomal protein L6 [Gammaproteobacteria bacterium]
MARTAVKPIAIAENVEVSIERQRIRIEGAKGTLELEVNSQVAVEREEQTLAFSPRNGGKDAVAHCGTARALVRNLMRGVVSGYERKLELNGVGFRAQAQGRKLDLTLGFSHPVQFVAPEGIALETPSQTEIFVRGIDKQLVGEVAAKIRRFRPPDAYKGKGLRYADERIVLKEAKKK